MAANLQIVNDIICQYVVDVRRVIPADKDILYGSYAKGTATEYSDADVSFFYGAFENRIPWMF